MYKSCKMYFVLVVLLFSINGLTPTSAQSTPSVSRIVSEFDSLQNGIVVVLGDKNLALTMQLVEKTPYLYYVQFPGEKDYLAAAKAADKAGLYGTRVFVEKGSSNHIGLADNIADYAIVLCDFKPEFRTEVIRVLHPEGIAIRYINEKIKTFNKPIPEGLDNWSHPYHGPDNNPLSEDKFAKGPYMTQFLADPRYGPLPQVALASSGRIFKAFGHIAFKVREEPLLNTLVAYNGFNGMELWRHELSSRYMIHRNTMVAMPDKVYVADDKSCKVLCSMTGKLLNEIKPDENITGGTFWKWMALEDGIIYAMVGRQEQIDPVVMQKRQAHGWPWNPLSKGFNQPDQPWGYGKTILAINPDTKEILWHHKEQTDMDSRATCMKNGKLFIFGFGKFLACLNTETGKEIWRKTPENYPELFKSLGNYSNRQDWRTNWRTTAYLKCSDKALYFSGPQVNKLLAVSAENGKILWEDPYNNFQLIIRPDSVYGISGQIDDGHLSKVFDPLTGKVLQEIPIGRRACTRPTSALDAVFFRANGGSMRLDIHSNLPQLISPMRPPCQDGVTIANGLLYWWPSVCDCNLTLYGISSLAPAGDFDFEPTADHNRLEKNTDTAKVLDLNTSENDWPAFRANNQCTAVSGAQVNKPVNIKWKNTPAKGIRLTPPIAAGSMAFTAGDNGCVYAYDIKTGIEKWKAYTSGAIRIAPALWNNRIYVGSADGYAYCFEAVTGRQLWRFRVAPRQRKIPVYGKLMSTWPVGSGVLVDNGVAYAAGGIVNYDGTYIFALDAVTGEIKWQNNSSGHLNREINTGVSVQGHMLLFGNTLCMAGGNAVSPATYDINTGTCTNNIKALQRRVNNNLLASMSPRGWELYQYGSGVICCGKPFYAHPDYAVYDQTVFQKSHLASTDKYDFIWVNNSKIICYPKIEKGRQKKLLAAWGKTSIQGADPVWQFNCPDSRAFALCKNTVVAAMPDKVVALDLENGSVTWQKPLPACPELWAMAVDAQGKIVLTLENGQIICF